MIEKTPIIIGKRLLYVVSVTLSASLTEEAPTAVYD